MYESTLCIGLYGINKTPSADTRATNKRAIAFCTDYICVPAQKRKVAEQTSPMRECRERHSSPLSSSSTVVPQSRPTQHAHGVRRVDRQTRENRTCRPKDFVAILPMIERGAGEERM